MQFSQGEIQQLQEVLREEIYFQESENQRSDRRSPLYFGQRWGSVS